MKNMDLVMSLTCHLYLKHRYCSKIYVICRGILINCHNTLQRLVEAVIYQPSSHKTEINRNAFKMIAQHVFLRHPEAWVGALLLPLIF